MGCDIHMYAEVKRRDEWEAVGRVFEDESNAAWEIHPYTGRNYDLFAVLADVRNSFGIRPIAEPRGVPDDVSRYVRNEFTKWGCNGHSASWLTVSELEAYPWNEINTHGGWVSLEGYRTFKEKGRPESWSGGVGGGTVVHVSNAEMDDFLRGGPRDPNKRYYTRIEWPWRIGDATREFTTKTLPALRGLFGKSRVEDVRIVFWFDN